ncbi:conjugative relaxase [Salmonella enterica]|nr:conjugative relaxase [Salmonella enterica]EBR1292757.1 conjugative relaxase [Salmonella enterica]
MLSHMVLTRQDIGRAASYYEDGADDYYAKEGDATEWQGKGAEELGLSGEVDSNRFRELLAGNIGEGHRIMRSATRQDSKERIGLDLTFSAPKSVSLQALVAGDAEIIKAHDRAVARTLEQAEARAQARQKIQGKTRIETTGNLVIGKFRHETSRERDPQLHTHAVILNMTKRSDGQWRALKNDEIVKATRYLGAVYNAELAHELQKLGYQLRYGKDGNFELAHINRQQLEGFSQRSARVEEYLAKQGLTRETASAQERQQAAMHTRSKKVSIEREALHAEWQAKAKELGIDFSSRGWSGREKGGSEKQAHSFMPSDEAAKRAVRYAVNHLTERQSVMDERELVDTAMKHAVGAARLEDIQKEILRQTETGYLIREAPRYRPGGQTGPTDEPGKTRAEWIAELAAKGMKQGAARERVDNAIKTGGLVPIEPRYTTQTALEREKRILQIERDGRGAVAPVIAAEAARERLASTNLNQGQRDAAELIVSATDRVVGVQGFAGTGKSHMLDTAKTMIEQEGYQVRALAPYGSQVKALRELNVQANTVASFLRAKDKNIDGRTVLVIDEAGVMPTRQMEQVLKIAEKAGARVVLMGDTAQTKAIEAGRPFDQLQAAGMKTAHMSEIQRQKDPELKIAVELAAKGDARSSLQRIKDVIEVKNHHERRAAVADAYMALKPEDRERTLIVSGTNEARREINRMVREGLGTAGKGIEFDTLVRVDTTQAERRFSKNYQVGYVIQPERDYERTGLKRGELYRVEDTGPGNRLTVRADRDGQRIEFSPMTHTKISVYQPERAELAVGDMVRITRNDKDRDLANGDRMKVVAVHERVVTVTDGKRNVELPTDKPLHVDHAYATTVHSSQGLTSDRVLIDAHAESRTTAKDVYYVAVSRARYEARIFTNDLRKLPAAIARENVKTAAHDLARERGSSAVERQRREQEAQRSRQSQHQQQERDKGTRTREVAYEAGR